MVCITGQVASQLIGYDAFQETDVTGITLPITKHNYLVTDVDDIMPAHPRGFYIARIRPARPGAGRHHQGCPAGFHRTGNMTTRPIRLPGYRPDLRPCAARSCSEAAELINAAKRPVILAGHGVLMSGAMAEVRRVRRNDPASPWR